MVPNILQFQHSLGTQSAAENSVLPSSCKLFKVRWLGYLTLNWQGLIHEFILKMDFSYTIINTNNHLWYLTLWVV